MDNDSKLSVSRRRYVGSVTAGLTGISLAGCTGTENQATGTESTGEGSSDGTAGGKADTFVVGSSSKPSTLDIHKATRRPEETVLSALHEPLFRLNENKEPVPHLAADYSVNEDATEFLFQIEQGVTFHNGDELTAEEVVYNWERFVENSPSSYLLSPAKAFEATGEYEVTVTFDAPYPLLPRYLTDPLTGFVSKRAVEEAGESYGQEIAVGTGPYQWKNWEHGTAIVLSKFEEYGWGPEFAANQGPGNPEKFRFEIHPEATTLLNELTSGGVHGSSYITLSDTKEVEQADSTNLIRKQYTRPGYLAINVEKKPTDNVHVRRAITHAVRKQPVIEAALGGEGYPIWSIVPPVAVNALGEEKAKELGQTVSQEKAREELDAAGWTNSKQGEVRTKNGEELKLTFYAFTIPRYKKMGKVVAPLLGEVGIKAELEILEAGTLYKNLQSGNHNITTMAYGGNWAVNALEPILKGENTATEGGTNYSLWQNDEFDSLLEKAKTSPDQATREQAILDAQKVVLEEVPVTPICAFNKVYGHKKSVSGIDSWTEHPWWPDQEWLNRLELDV
ncbi:ABC transporter substrate-binding protein [Halogeometricum borinquense]|uniref:ABC transporter substrate-binding protein n=1 Tax=Halogeometricum borinquense TaxID=60847 RepID=A0A6C0UJL0_9EURY|nr:ABC transporter substrate-binding protein [Halogeometricum borinquense]QIB75625.1 ABC transporter substrate-binding protein [Halogeometricum borinquense]